MTYTGNRHGIVLAAGLLVVAAAALSPAGLRGEAVPGWAWTIWIASAAIGVAVSHRAGVPLPEALRRTAWLLPVVLMFAVPAAVFAPEGRRVIIACALACRALSAAAAGASIAAWLGPSGLVRGTRQLGAPARLADVIEATLASLTVVLRQAGNMLRAREARRTAYGAWSDIAAAPLDTTRGFGRLVAALLLRSLERAEALERARRARGWTL